MLKRDIKIKTVEKGKEKIRSCQVKYERLPRFCFYCGIVGHHARSCLIPEEHKSVRFCMEQRASPYKSFEHRSFYVPSALVPAKKSLRFGPPSPTKWRLGLSANTPTASKTPIQSDAEEAEERTETDPKTAAEVLGMASAVDKLSVRDTQAQGIEEDDIALLTLGRAVAEKEGLAKGTSPTEDHLSDGSGLQKERELRAKLLKKRRGAAAARMAGSFMLAKDSILGKRRETVAEELSEEEKDGGDQSNTKVSEQKDQRAPKKTKNDDEGDKGGVMEDGVATSLGAAGNLTEPEELRQEP